jgi:hypothetical protein
MANRKTRTAPIVSPGVLFRVVVAFTAGFYHGITCRNVNSLPPQRVNLIPFNIIPHVSLRNRRAA